MNYLKQFECQSDLKPDTGLLTTTVIQAVFSAAVIVSVTVPIVFIHIPLVASVGLIIGVPSPNL